MTVKTNKQGIVNYILLTWLLCGTLDALSAIIINLNVTAAAIFRYIAGGFLVRLQQQRVVPKCLYTVFCSII